MWDGSFGGMVVAELAFGVGGECFTGIDEGPSCV